MLITLMWQNSHIGNNQDCVICLPETPKATEFIFVLEFIPNSVNLRAHYRVLKTISDFMDLFGCDSIWMKFCIFQKNFGLDFPGCFCTCNFER